MKLQSLFYSTNESVNPVETAQFECPLNKTVLQVWWRTEGRVQNSCMWKEQTQTRCQYQNFAVSKVYSVIPASPSSCLFQSLSPPTLKISSSHWSMSTSDWLLHMFVCCLLWPERQSLSTFDVRTFCDLKWEHRHWRTSQLTHPFFSVIGGSSYQTVGNKIIIKDICSGDSTFIIAQASIKPPSLVHARLTMS